MARIGLDVEPPMRTVVGMRLTFPWAMAGLLLVTTAACHQRETDVAVGNRTGHLLIGNGGDIQYLDPHTAGGLIDHYPISAMFEGLVTLDETTLQPRPGMAERWDVSADGLTYVFHLRDGLRWSNGDPLTIADLLFSFRRALAPALASEYKDLYFPVRNAEAFARGDLKDFAQVGFRAVDAHTLEVTLERRTPYFLTLLRNNVWYPVEQAAVERDGAFDDRANRWTRRLPLPGNGPFRLVAWREHQNVEVEKNPFYWDAAHVRLNGVTFFSNESLQSQEFGFRAGQLHITWSVPLSKLQAYREQEPELLRVEPSLESYFIRFNVTRKPFDDVRVRRAFSLAIDRDAIVRDILKGGQLPAHSLTPRAFAGYHPPDGAASDPEEARRELAAAGFPGGRGFPRVDYLTIASETDQRIGEALQQRWRRVLGVEVGIAQQEFKIYLESIRNTVLNYSLARGRWTPEYPDPLGLLVIMTGGNGINGTGFSDPVYDRLLAAANEEADPARRSAALARAETRLLEEAPIAPVYFGTAAHLIRPAVQGWKLSPLGFHNYQDAWLRP